MKAFLVGLGLASLFLASCSSTGSGARVSDDGLNQVQTALGQARSWHVASTLQASGQTMHFEDDVVCPFLLHRIGQLKPGGPEEIIATKDTYNYREGSQWFSLHSSGNDYCRDGPKAGDSGLAATLEALRGRYSFRKGESRVISGISCADWESSEKQSDGKTPDSVLCVNADSHLPYEFRLGAQDFLYSKWGESFVIQPPPSPSAASAP